MNQPKRIFRVYRPKRIVVRSQKWWITIDAVNEESLFRSTEGYSNRAEAVQIAEQSAHPGDVIMIFDVYGNTAHSYIYNPV